MYSDSIRERQQELLDVLFKKASGGSEATFIKSAGPQLTDDDVNLMRQQIMGNGRKLAQEEKVKKERALKEEYQRLVEEYKHNNPNGKFTKVTKSNLMHNAERNVKDRHKQESYKQMEQAHRRGGIVAFSPTPSAPAPSPANPSAEGAVSIPKPKVDTPNPVDVGEVDLEDVGYDDSGIQFPKTPDALPLPKQTPTSTPEKKLVSPAPKEKSKEEKKKEDKKNDSKTDPITLAKALIDKAWKHKAISIGGIGGAGLGAILGKSTRDKILYALLGGAGGSGLGYLLEKYINNSAPVLPVIKSGSYMQKLANDTNQNNGGFGLGLSNVDWDKMKNDTINLIRNHKLETLGGAGGLVLGSLFGGNSFAERMLMAGLGTLAGGGLGHLVSKYKN